MATYRQYRQAAALLWGDAGEYAAAEFERLNVDHFHGSIPPMPVIIGLRAYGRCLGGLTRDAWLAAPRITIAPDTPGGPPEISDVILHDMTHARLMLSGLDHAHNGQPWCDAITGLSPAVLGQEIDAQPVVPRRVPNPDRERDPAAPKTRVVRLARPGALTRDQLATWPHALRPAGYYQGGTPITVPTY